MELYMATHSLSFFGNYSDPNMCSDSDSSCLVLYVFINKNSIAPYICTASDHHSHSMFYSLFPSQISTLATLDPSVHSAQRI